MVNVTENLNSVRTASESTEPVSAAIEEAKTKVEEAQGRIAAAVEEAKTAMLEVGNAIENAQTAADSARQTTEDHLQRSRELEHYDAVAHLEQAEDYINGAIGHHDQNHDQLQGTVSQLTEVGETAGKGLAGVAAGLDERLGDATAAREGLEQAKEEVLAVGEA